MDFFGEFPKLLTDLISTSASNPSQLRARALTQAARDGDVATIQSIGRGAMAARNPPVRNLELMIDVLSLGSDQSVLVLPVARMERSEMRDGLSARNDPRISLRSIRATGVGRAAETGALS